MIENNISHFISSLDRDRPTYLEKIRREAHSLSVPIIRDETASLLRCLIKIKKPKRVLEIGTAIGYSTLVIADALDMDSEIYTIENYEERYERATQNFIENNETSRIHLYKGEAGSILKEFSSDFQEFDFIFLDAAKAQYPIWLDDILSILKKDGILISDNVLQDGTLINSRFLVDRRDRTIHERMREYLYRIKHEESLESAIVPIGDGISISVKIK